MNLAEIPQGISVKKKRKPAQRWFLLKPQKVEDENSSKCNQTHVERWRQKLVLSTQNQNREKVLE